MDMRAEVWSPLQNTAVWLGAWLWGHESTDALIEAVTELQGPVRGSQDEPLVEVLSRLRTEATGLLVPGSREPVLRLILSGPGQAPALPAGSESAQAASLSPAGAIVVRTTERDRHIVVVPHTEVYDGWEMSQWEMLVETLPLPAPAWLSPGEADALLARATDEAATLIEATGYHSDALPNPRLTVGTLSDFYDAPGLPASIPGRAAKLFARADRVAAIIETVTDRIGDHSLDPQLLCLWHYIRQARMAGVSYALSEFAGTVRRRA